MKGVRFKRVLIGLAILIAIVGAGVIAPRKPLLSEGLEWWLADLDVPVGAVTVERLDHRALVLRNISLGPGDVLSARTVEVAYALPDLISGQVQAVRLDSLQIAVDLQRDPAQLEKVAALYRRVSARLSTGSDAAGTEIPRVFVGDSRLLIADTGGLADIAFAASVQPEVSGGVTVSADLITGRIETPAGVLEDISGPVSAALPPGDQILLSSDLAMTAAISGPERHGPFALQAKVGAEFDASGDALDLSLALAAPEAGVDMRAGARLFNVLVRPEGSFNLSGTIDAAGSAWNAMAGLASGNGAITTDFAGALSINPQIGHAASRSDGPAAVRISGTGRLAADVLEIEGLGRTATERVGFEMNATPTSLDLQILPGSILSVAPAETMLAGLPTAVADLLVGEHSVDLSQSTFTAVLQTSDNGADRWRAEIQPRLALQAQDGARLSLQSKAELEGGGDLQLTSVEGETDLVLGNLSVALPGLQARDVRADLAFGFSAEPTSLEMRLLRPGALSVGTLSTNTLRTQAPVTFTLAAGTFKSDGPKAPGRAFSASLDMRADDTIRTVMRVGGADHAADARLGPVRLTGTGTAGDCSTGTVAIKEARLDAAGEAVELQDTRFTLSHDCPGGGLLASADVSAARHLGDRPLLAPVTARAHLTDTEDGYAFDGTVSLTDGTGLFIVAGGAAADGSSGEITVARTAPLVFAADGATPADISAALGDLRRVRGQLDGTARYRWSADGTSSAAQLDLRDLDFDLGAVAVRDLDLGLALQPAWPPVTPAGQTLSVGRIDTGSALEGAALEEIEVTYDLLATTPTRLRINGAEGRFLGGTVRLAPFTVDPGQPRTEMVLHVAGLDMAALAALTKMETLDATGRLDGKIPVVMDEGRIGVRGGRLDADGPGRLSFSSARAAELLRGRGTEIDLMLEALKDFRYESLGIDLDKTAADDLTFRLSLLGNNPEVLDGHPFRVNLNLTSQITPVLDALNTLYRMSRETLERVWTSR